ncbi:MAG: DEAD/DEAH box helicase [Methanosarcinales archaeon]|nr:DEAD/DEAH box helicase [Methanosarcinales archaeon]
MTPSVLVNPQRSKITIMQVTANQTAPLFCGTLTLTKTSSGMRPQKFMSENRFKKPSEAIGMLRSAGQILIADGGDPKATQEFLEMLRGYQLSYTPVRVCRYCLLEDMFTLIDKRSIKFKGGLLCQRCALEELKSELRHLKLRGLGAERIEELLLRTRDLDRILGMLDLDRLDSKLTLYRTIDVAEPLDAKRRTVRDLPLPERFKNLLAEKIDELLPVQSLAIENGLLRGASQLIVSETATGKTLIGELAGVKNLLEGRGNVIFVVPLVALANQKELDFAKRYSPLGIVTVPQVGVSRIRRDRGRGLGQEQGQKQKQGQKKSPTKSTTIWVGTYEGVDYLLRSGKAERLGKIGTVVIDEVHTLADEERGHRMDGLIARLKHIAPAAQFIYLSATVGDPVALSETLNAGLVRYEARPVPIELHLIFAGEHDKIRLIDRLASQEWGVRSSKGYRGQTIVFTNSRQRCHKIAKALRIGAAAYHAGLSRDERRRISQAFADGKLAVVVTTAALAAGVDFPASQVLFESLAMGIDWLTVHEFHQMLGRAGRPDYHDLGKVALLVEPDRKYHAGKETEDEIAFRLLNHEIEPVDAAYEEPEQIEELLASSALASDKEELRQLNNLLIGGGDFEYLFRRLVKYGLLTPAPSVRPTEFGKIVATHFLSVEQAFLIRDAVKNGVDPIDIAVSLETLDSVYFKNAPRISAALKMNVPSRVFQGAAYDLVFSGESIALLDGDIREETLSFMTEFMACSCKDAPYCGCPERLFAKKLIELRREGLDPGGIVREIGDYGVYAYPGDVLEYLDHVVRNLEAIGMIARVFGNKAIAIAAEEVGREVVG